jgi:2-polyprenyl-3-methyl-5-hydroxy-6-metoxy-1,4-benzoquinol methylase
MKVLNNAGYHTEGYEISEYGRAFTQKNGFTVYDALEKIPENTYDLVTAIEVLEHCHSPLKALRAIQKALKPGGWFYYTTLNFDNWKELNNDRREGYMTPEGHIQFFSTPVMKQYFKKVGLTPQEFSRKSYLKGGRLYKFLAKKNLANQAHDFPQTWLEKIAWKAGILIGHQFNIKLRTLPLARK